jgi:hypothetical protein
MGYYTRHNLEIINGDNDLIAEFRSSSEEAEYAIEDNGGSSDSSKWYRHEADLKAFSLIHPSVLFKLSGEGEESGDIWIEYYKNGKMQQCKANISFDDFDESKLAS